MSSLSPRFLLTNLSTHSTADHRQSGWTACRSCVELVGAQVTTPRYGDYVRHRRCRECFCVFRPSSRHLRCPSCRSRNLCRCGEVKQLKSETCGRCRDQSGQANGNWKGGRTRHKAGYLMVRALGHPRATSGPYVFEHILVAEDLLGRYLLDGETVHHRNGIRDDNRPENLELWTNPQPSVSG